MATARAKGRSDKRQRGAVIHSRARVMLQAGARKVVRPLSLSIVLALLIAPIAISLALQSLWEFRDDSPERGAAVRAKDKFGPGYDEVRYLPQNWTTGESAWFHNVNQGSDLLPYDFFLSLTLAGSDEPLTSARNVERWRYLPQIATKRNPDALPVGFARDEYQGRAYVGLTCAACHTAQVNYKGVGLRIDGGPSMADMQTFMRDLVDAVSAAAQLDAQGRCKNAVCQQFVQRVLARGNYDTAADVTADLLKTQRRLVLDDMSNRSDSRYGFARLDAFGRIYNRVLGRILRKEDLKDILPDIYNSAELPDVQKTLEPILTDKKAGEARDAEAKDAEVMERAVALLSGTRRQKLIDAIFNPSSAPVSYPFLWDTPQHDFVQWNGIVSNATFGPIGRNAGEVIGVFGTLDWNIQDDGFSFSALVSGQNPFKPHISYESSIYVHNLRRIEAQLARLQSPQWPEDVLGKIKWGRIYNGKILFAQYCVTCHTNIVHDSPDRRIVASFTKLDPIGTDRTMAENSLNYAGYSGMLRNQYVGFPVGGVLIERTAPVAVLLTQATRGVIAEPYPNVNVFRRAADWVSDLARAFVSNEIRASIKAGNYDPDTTAAPFVSLLAYKGRSLNGIWATAPYLHNGSVPTLYDILLPKRQAGSPEGDEYRPDTFLVGSREFDPTRVGFVSEGYDGFEFDTSQAGNSNAGHEYGTVNDTRPGLRPMTPDERGDLLEYLKTL